MSEFSICLIILYTVTAAASCAVFASKRNGDFIAPDMWEKLEGDVPTEEEYERERIIGARLMLLSPVWPLLLTGAALYGLYKLVTLITRNLWRIGLGTGRVWHDATKQLSKGE